MKKFARTIAVSVCIISHHSSFAQLPVLLKNIYPGATGANITAFAGNNLVIKFIK